MKKIALFALLFAAAANSAAFAHSYPQMGKVYICSYSNYSGVAKNPGYSWWERRTGSTTELLFTTEHFEKANGSWDGYFANWSYPRTDSYGFTWWEFRFKNGPLCQALVTPGGYTISFQSCTDGHIRSCYTE